MIQPNQLAVSLAQLVERMPRMQRGSEVSGGGGRTAFYVSFSASDVIVGVNKYKLEREEPLEVLSIDNSRVLEIQV